MDALKVQIITRDFNRMLEQLAAIDPRVEFSTVVREVAVRVIQGALNRTRAANPTRIRQDAKSKEYVTFDGKRYNLDNHYPDALWGRLEQFMSDRLAIKLASRGLSKQSWLHMGSELGANLKAPAYVRTANYQGATHPENADTQEQGSTTDYALTIINSSPIVQAAGGEAALIYAMAGQTRYFETLMAHRAFRTFESRARAYPGIFVRETLAA